MPAPFSVCIVAAEVHQISVTTALAVIGGFAILVVAVILIFRKIERDRTEALRQAGTSFGFTFEERGDVDQIRGLGDLPLFGHGRSKRVKNVLSGWNTVGDVRIFDYQYTTGGGKSSHTWSQTVALYPGSRRDLPDFMLSPENPIFRALGHMLRWQDINFESNPVFSSSFILRGPDETAIRAAFTADTLGFLEQHKGWTIEVQAGTVGVYRAEQRVKPSDVATFVQDATTLVQGIRGRAAAPAR